MQGVTYAERPFLMWNDGKVKFTERGCGEPFRRALVGRGSAVADFDNDGGMDIAVSNSGGPLALLRNEGKRGNWVGILLRGKTSNRQGIGARVTLESASGRQVREVKAGGSYLSSSDPRIHFGIGTATSVERLEISGRPSRRRKARRGFGGDVSLRVSIWQDELCPRPPRGRALPSRTCGSGLRRPPRADNLPARAGEARRKGDFVTARRLYEEALRQDPESGPVALALAETLTDMGEAGAAEELLLRLVRSLPDRPEPRRALARAYLLQDGKASEALAQAQRALELDPANVESRIVLVSALRAAGRPQRRSRRSRRRRRNSRATRGRSTNSRWPTRFSRTRRPRAPSSGRSRPPPRTPTCASIS
jgi:hypothetical protein